MPLTPTATRTGRYSVTYTWSGTAPFNVWLDGINVLQNTTATTYTAQSTDGTTNPLPAIEVLDDTDTDAAQSQAYSPRVKFQWRGQADASLYIIEYFDDGEWTPIASVKESGIGYYSFESTAQGDGETVQFRVIAQDSRGYQSLPLTLSHTVVCNPAPPAVAYTYSAGTGLLTVAGV